jgi:hypothetical protein
MEMELPHLFNSCSLSCLFNDAVIVEAVVDDRIFKEYGAAGGIRMGKGNRSTRKKIWVTVTSFITNPSLHGWNPGSAVGNR